MCFIAYVQLSSIDTWWPHNVVVDEHPLYWLAKQREKDEEKPPIVAFWEKIPEGCRRSNARLKPLLDQLSKK